LIKVLGIFSYEIVTILWSNVTVFNFECQAWITIRIFLTQLCEWGTWCLRVIHVLCLVSNWSSVIQWRRVVLKVAKIKNNSFSGQRWLWVFPGTDSNWNPGVWRRSKNWTLFMVSTNTCQLSGNSDNWVNAFCLVISPLIKSWPSLIIRQNRLVFRSYSHCAIKYSWLLVQSHQAFVSLHTLFILLVYNNLFKCLHF
jgi:hypothetical protein